jgi:hypothetical protein
MGDQARLLRRDDVADVHVFDHAVDRQRHVVGVDLHASPPKSGPMRVIMPE